MNRKQNTAQRSVNTELDTQRKAWLERFASWPAPPKAR